MIASRAAAVITVGRVAENVLTSTRFFGLFFIPHNHSVDSVELCAHVQVGRLGLDYYSGQSFVKSRNAVSPLVISMEGHVDTPSQYTTLHPQYSYPTTMPCA